MFWQDKCENLHGEGNTRGEMENQILYLQINQNLESQNICF